MKENKALTLIGSMPKISKVPNLEFLLNNRMFKHHLKLSNSFKAHPQDPKAIKVIELCSLRQPTSTCYSSLKNRIKRSLIRY